MSIVKSSDDKQDAVAAGFESMATADDQHFRSFKIHRLDAFLLTLFFSLFAVVFLQFFTRYVLNNSIAWTEEAARYLLIVLAFAGAVRCQLKGTHIALEFMDKYYGRQAPLVQLAVLLLTLAILIVLAWSAAGLIERTYYQRMISLPLPKYYLHAAVLLMLFVNMLVVLYQLWQAIQ